MKSAVFIVIPICSMLHPTCVARQKLIVQYAEFIPRFDSFWILQSLYFECIYCQ